MSIVRRWLPSFPTAQGTATILIDVGANVDSKPQNLQQFAIMGDVYFRTIFAGRFPTADHPRVGVLSIGEEESKGNELTREAYKLIKELPMNFVGNVEGRDLYNGKADVLVCDGFVGNVALKISEGMVETVRFLLKQSLQATITSQVGFLLSRGRSPISRSASTTPNTAARRCWASRAFAS